jgi:hypothetical protein
MNMGLRLAVVIGFIAICCGSLAIANRVPEVKPVEQFPPSPYYIQDGAESQYFPTGPEFKLQRQASAMKAYQNDLEGQRVRR